MALRNLAAAYGTEMPRYLLAPEVAVLLSKMTDLRKRFFIDTLWNTGGRLNEILPLTRDDFALDSPATGPPLETPLVVLRTLKQRRLEDGRAGAAAQGRTSSRRNGMRRLKYAPPPPAGGAAHRSGVRAALKGVVCYRGSRIRGAALEHEERGHGAQLDKPGRGRARRRDVLHPAGDAENVQGLIYDALGAAPGTAEGDPDANGAYGREVDGVVLADFCAGRDAAAGRAVIHGSDRGALPSRHRAEAGGIMLADRTSAYGMPLSRGLRIALYCLPKFQYVMRENGSAR